MSQTRGRKSRKGRWQLVLGVQEATLGLVGISALMVLSFALGTLAGRGDLYRILSSWGLLGSETIQAPSLDLPQASLPPLVPAVPLPGAARKLQQGSIATLPGPQAVTQPPGKFRLSDQRGPYSRAEELRQLREEVVKKLKFQNSLESWTFKPAHKSRGVGPRGTGTVLVRVDKYRDRQAARARVAELCNQGEAVTLKEGRDQEGPYFLVYRHKSAAAPAAPSSRKPIRQPQSRLKTKR